MRHQQEDAVFPLLETDSSCKTSVLSYKTDWSAVAASDISDGSDETWYNKDSTYCPKLLCPLNIERYITLEIRNVLLVTNGYNETRSVWFYIQSWWSRNLIIRLIWQSRVFSTDIESYSNGLKWRFRNLRNSLAEYEWSIDCNTRGPGKWPLYGPAQSVKDRGIEIELSEVRSVSWWENDEIKGQ